MFVFPTPVLTGHLRYITPGISSSPLMLKHGVAIYFWSSPPHGHSSSSEPASAAGTLLFKLKKQSFVMHAMPARQSIGVNPPAATPPSHQGTVTRGLIVCLFFKESTIHLFLMSSSSPPHPNIMLVKPLMLCMCVSVILITPPKYAAYGSLQNVQDGCVIWAKRVSNHVQAVMGSGEFQAGPSDIPVVVYVHGRHHVARMFFAGVRDTRVLRDKINVVEDIAAVPRTIPGLHVSNVHQAGPVEELRSCLVAVSSQVPSKQKGKPPPKKTKQTKKHRMDTCI